jgi:hypothetical protein
VRKGFLVIAACLLLAACGSSSTPPKTTVPQLSKAAFANILGSICTRANEAFAAANTNAAAVSVIEHYLIVFAGQNTPSSERSTYGQYLAVLHQELNALKNGHRSELVRLAQTKAKPLAKALGATGCIT